MLVPLLAGSKNPLIFFLVKLPEHSNIFSHPSCQWNIERPSYCNSYLSWRRSRCIHRRVVSLVGTDPMEPLRLSIIQVLAPLPSRKSSSLPGIAAAILSHPLQTVLKPDYCTPKSFPLHNLISEVSCPQHALLWFLRVALVQNSASRTQSRTKTDSNKRQWRLAESSTQIVGKFPGTCFSRFWRRKLTKK